MDGFSPRVALKSYHEYNSVCLLKGGKKSSSEPPGQLTSFKLYELSCVVPELRPGTYYKIPP